MVKEAVGENAFALTAPGSRVEAILEAEKHAPGSSEADSLVDARRTGKCRGTYIRRNGHILVDTEKVQEADSGSKFFLDALAGAGIDVPFIQAAEMHIRHGLPEMRLESAECPGQVPQKVCVQIAVAGLFSAHCKGNALIGAAEAKVRRLYSPARVGPPIKRTPLYPGSSPRFTPPDTPMNHWSKNFPRRSSLWALEGLDSR